VEEKGRDTMGVDLNKECVKYVRIEEPVWKSEKKSKQRLSSWDWMKKKVFRNNIKGIPGKIH